MTQFDVNGEPIFEKRKSVWKANAGLNGFSRPLSATHPTLHNLLGSDALVIYTQGGNVLVSIEAIQSTTIDREAHVKEILAHKESDWKESERQTLERVKRAIAYVRVWSSTDQLNGGGERVLKFVEKELGISKEEKE